MVRNSTRDMVVGHLERTLAEQMEMHFLLLMNKALAFARRSCAPRVDSFASPWLSPLVPVSLSLPTVEAIRPSRERGLEPAYICPYKNVQSTLVQIGKTLVQTFCSGTKFCSGLLTTEVLGWAR